MIIEQKEANEAVNFNVNMTKTPANNRQVPILDFVKDVFIRGKDIHKRELKWIC